MSARRRHKAGVKPYMGTQWALALNPPQYHSTHSLPIYSATYNDSSNRNGFDVEAQRVPEAAHVPLERSGRKS